MTFYVKILWKRKEEEKKKGWGKQGIVLEKSVYSCYREKIMSHLTTLVPFFHFVVLYFYFLLLLLFSLFSLVFSLMTLSIFRHLVVICQRDVNLFEYILLNRCLVVTIIYAFVCLLNK